MIATFKVRKAATSDWVRRSERDWIKAPCVLKPAASSPRLAFGPVRDLLTCNRAVLAAKGREIIRWLDEQKGIQTSILDWLSHRVLSGRVMGQAIEDFNCIAAIEILARHGHRSTPHLIERHLAGPVRENHIYAMPLARLQQTIKSPEMASIAGHIVRLYEESRALDPVPRWRGRFSVEAFRTLADSAPRAAFGSVASDLPNVADLELTPILESLSIAARKVEHPLLVESPIRAAAKSVWERYARDKSATNLGNRPGIMGRLLELLGRSGEDLSACLATLDGHPLRMQVLYQFVQRPLEFAPVRSRFKWYAAALKLMVEAKQNLAVTKFLTEVVVPDMPPELQKSIISTLTKE